MTGSLLFAPIILATASLGSGFEGSVDAFDAACRAPGADPAAQRIAIATVAQPAEPQAAGSETFDGPAGRYILIGMGNLAMCALNTSFDPQSLPTDASAWIESRYGSKPKLRTSGMTTSYAWAASNRDYKIVLADDASTHVLLMSVTHRR